MGPFREIRTKKTAPGGSIKDKKTAPCGCIKDEKDRASWSESGPDGSLQGNKDEKDRATWIY